MKRVLLVLCFIFSATFVMAELDYDNLREDQVIVSYEDVMNSRGDYFTAQIFATLGNGSSIYFLIDLTTATKNMHVNYEVTASSGAFDTHVRKDVVVASSGTISRINSYNRANVKNSEFAIYDSGGGAVINTVSPLEYTLSNGNQVYRNPVTWIFQKGEVYLIDAHNEMAGTQILQIRLRFW